MNEGSCWQSDDWEMKTEKMGGGQLNYDIIFVSDISTYQGVIFILVYELGVVGHHLHKAFRSQTPVKVPLVRCQRSHSTCLVCLLVVDR